MPFTPKNRPVCNNVSCKKTIRERNKRKQSKTDPDRFCIICGKQIVIGTKRKTYCSEECNAIGQHKKQVERISRRLVARRNSKLNTEDHKRDTKGRFASR
jgi:predicted nucleic acid-binding Zn ribbon protein